MIGRIARIVVSLLISVIPLLYLAGYLNFLGLPSPSTLGFTGSGGTNPYSLELGSLSSFVPLGGYGLTGLIAYSLISRISRVSTSAMASSRMGSSSGSMTNFMNMMQGQYGRSPVPEALPSDLSRPQYVILRELRLRGKLKTGDIAKIFSMNKKDAETEINALRANGYLSVDDRLTSKAIGILG